MKHVIIFLCIVFATDVFAGSITYDRANQLYHNQDYTGANELYMQMINEGVINGSVYYNAGNSYFHLKKYGWALWCYKKAMQYEPTNHLYVENFLIVKKKIGRSSFEQMSNTAMNWWQKIVHHYLLADWAWMSFAFFCAAAFIWSMRKIFAWPAFTIALPKLFSFLFIITMIAGIGNYISGKFCSYGIIVKNTQLFEGAKQSGNISTSKTEGLQVAILDKQFNTATNSTRILIQLLNGKKYWINDKDIVSL